MSEPATIWSVTAAKDGKPEGRQPYVPPQESWPVRDYYIVERATGTPLLDCAGRGRLCGKEGDGAETRYRLLPNPHDWMHATAMTAMGAKERALAWGLNSKLFKITNQKPTKPKTT